MRRKKSNFSFFLVLLLLSIGLGYAFLQTDLTINGTGKITATSWNIYFDNIRVMTGSATLQPGDSAPTINPTTLTEIGYIITLKEPGEFYEFTVDVVNDGSLNAMIGSITSKLNGTEISSTNPIPAYLNYSITYEDDVPIALNQLLASGTTETYKVRLEYRTDINPSDLPDTAETLTFSYGIEYVQANENAQPVTSLYRVLKNAATVGTYALKYTGDHQDSYAGTGTKDIYHWYATSDTNGTAIRDMNKVIFAGHCWEMIRTTDTGGVKLVYNGEVENGQCLNTRGTHVGYNSRTTQDMSTTYYYGTSYTYDSTNSVFSLSGTVTTGEIKKGEYTCKQTTESGTCATLYYIYNPAGGTSYDVIILDSSSHYSQFGALLFNRYDDSPAYVGYMYNPNTLIRHKSIAPVLSGSLYGTGVTYSGGNYTLTSTDTGKDANHHYTCGNTTGVCEAVRYYYYNNYYLELTGGRIMEEALEEMLHGSDVNKADSMIKTGIDKWYEKYLSNYGSYLEDTIFCNDRSTKSIGAFNPNGGGIADSILFKESDLTTDLSCNLDTDKFSTLNPNAQLTYKVGLMSSPEMSLLNNNRARLTGKDYWLFSPTSFAEGDAIVRTVRNDQYPGYIGNHNVQSSYGVRPAISLKSGTTYTSGNGSMASPYIVN